MPLIGVNPRISQILFFSFCWSGVATCICFVAFRLGVRWHFFKRLFWDDALVVFALVCFIAQAISWSVEPRGLFLIYDLTTGRIPLTKNNLDLGLRALTVAMSAFILFLTSLWAIKISFLLFFKRIMTRIQGPKLWWWWFVTVVTVLSYFPTVGTLPFRCMASQDLAYIMTNCTSAANGRYYFSIFYYQMGADVTTDFLLISIPVVFLWNVALPLKKKLLLMGIFSLTLIIVAIAVVRIAVTGAKVGVAQDSAWIAFWAMIEMTIAIIVACLASFRQLFTKSNNAASGYAHGSGHSSSSSRNNSTRKMSVLPKRWRRGHQQSLSDRALMYEETEYSLDSEKGVQTSSKSSINKNHDGRSSQNAIPLKRASQAHVAHQSVAPTERKYMVVHQGSSPNSFDNPPYKPGFI